MLSLLKTLVVCFCVHQAIARPEGARHKIAKRWAYIENGDPQMRSIHTDCKQLVKEYSDGDMPFYEYTTKMKKCMYRQQRTQIPSYEDADYFTPSFNVPKTEKRFEMPSNQPVQNAANQYGNYGYDYNQYQNSYGNIDQRGNIATPQAPQYGVPQVQTQAQVFPANNYNYYQQSQPGNQVVARSEIPSYQEPNQPNPMYSSDIVKKDEIPRPDEQAAVMTF